MKDLTGRKNWIRGLVFHLSGKYLVSVSDDKTIHCWDLSQECNCVKTVDDSHGHLVGSIRWAPDVPVPAHTNGETNGVVNGHVKRKEDTAGKIRCVIATGSVDLNVGVFAG